MKRTTKAEWMAVMAVMAAQQREAYRDIRAEAWNRVLEKNSPYSGQTN